MSDPGEAADPRVHVGMVVRDADGRGLGKVTRCNAWGFEAVKGFWSPSEWVIRWDEVLEVAGGEVHVARSESALFELAAGKLPSTWSRVPAHESPGSPGKRAREPLPT